MIFSQPFLRPIYILQYCTKRLSYSNMNFRIMIISK